MISLDVDERVAQFMQAFRDLRTKLDLQTEFEIQIVASEVDEKLVHLGERTTVRFLYMLIPSPRRQI